MRLINSRSTLAQLTRTDWLIMGAGAVVFILVAFVRTLENALAVSMTFYVLATVIQSKWMSRDDPRLWALVGTVAAVQIPVAFMIYIPPRLAKAVCIGPGILEGVALWALANWAERRFPRA